MLAVGFGDAVECSDCLRVGQVEVLLSLLARAQVLDSLFEVLPLLFLGYRGRHGE